MALSVTVHSPSGLYRVEPIDDPALPPADSFVHQVLELHERGLWVREIAHLMQADEWDVYDGICEGRAIVREILRRGGNGWILPPW